MKRYTQIILAIFLSIFLLVSLTSCKKQATPPEEMTSVSSPGSTHLPGQLGQAPSAAPTEVEDITIRLRSAEVTRGEMLTPKISILPNNATGEAQYTLSSSDEAVLRQINGNWVAVGAGTAQLIATAENGVSGSVTVTVIVPVESISLGKGEIAMGVGESMTLTPTIIPSDATEQLAHYTSDNVDVASVSEDGTINAVSIGSAEIICTIDEVSTTLTVKVEVPVTGISVILDRKTYIVGRQSSITAEFTPPDATDKTFSVSISGTAASLIGENTISFDAAGAITITVKASNGITGKQTITIIDLADYAEEVFRLTNIERANEGLPPFSKKSALTKTAEVRAEEIIKLFSHDRPDGRDCFTAFDENNVDYSRAGENIAAGQKTPAEVVQAWMNSPGHRDSILKIEFGHMGVGITMDDNGRLYWSQNFTD